MAIIMQFHEQHFPSQHVPNVQPNTGTIDNALQGPADSDLGCYGDGVRRTLTDEQIAMFRHSEIQRILAERRRQEDLKEERQQHAEKLKGRPKQQAQDNQQSVAFESDERVHSRPDMPELSYDDDDSALQELKTPRTFQWPKLGP
ncbi:hypothetical protein LTR24_001983 [Lithohypha guttulata]|uniref:Uncharacterized protein n=1 Tax=Lithohypha guttulata TaxID=1690604 RepID=A0ABR0KJD4_9EURO|nr:hypothetical protein LTR24_001983 [Lithohypha guttulata]